MSTSHGSTMQDSPQIARNGHGRTAALTIGAVGVGYGDIGTSPLYAFREALRPAAADGLTQAEVLGVVSLLLWALILIVTLKYVLFLLRADNRGEGGILSLVALVQKKPKTIGVASFWACRVRPCFSGMRSSHRRYPFFPLSRA